MQVFELTKPKSGKKKKTTPEYESGRKKQTVLLGDDDSVPGSCSVGQETCELIPDLLSQQWLPSNGPIC